MSRFRLRVGLLLGLLAGLAATAADAEPLTLRYSATWGGGPAAEILLRIDEDGSVFENRLDIETVGLARLLSGFKAHVVSTGRSGAAEIAPLAYDAFYDSRRKRDKRINLQFVRYGASLLAEEGPENTSKDPLLPEQFRRDVIDPLSCITAIRRLVRERSIDRTGGFTLAVYDGSRRFDVEGSLESIETVPWGGTRIEAMTLRLLLRPVAGFDGETEDGYRPEAHAREVHVTVTNDARAIPLHMSVDIAYVPAVIALDRNTRL